MRGGRRVRARRLRDLALEGDLQDGRWAVREDGWVGGKRMGKGRCGDG